MSVYVGQTYLYISIAVFIMSLITIIIAQCQLRKLKRERHRLDRMLNRYNRAFNDDYDYYNGYDA